MVNLINNPGFETWTGGTTFTFPSGNGGPIADNWIGFTESDPGLTSTFSREAVIVDTGIYSLKAVVSTTTFPPFGTGALIEQVYSSPAVVGQVLTVTFRIRGSGGSSGVQVYPQIYDGNVFNTLYTNGTTNGTLFGIGVNQSINWTTGTMSVPYVNNSFPTVGLRFAIIPGNGGNSGTGTAPIIYLDTISLTAQPIVPIAAGVFDSTLAQELINLNTSNDITFGD